MARVSLFPPPARARARARGTRIASVLPPFLLGCILLGAPDAAPSTDRSGRPGPELDFDFWGFSVAPEPQTPGDELEIVGVLSRETTLSPIPLDFDANEYTVYIYGLVLEERTAHNGTVESHYRGGWAEIWGDPSFNAPFRYNSDPDQVPPLDPAEVPAHFADGNLIVQMAFDNFITLFWPAAGIGTVAYTATGLQVVGGNAYKALKHHNMITRWHMGGGFTDDDRAYIPAGYGMRYDTVIRWEKPLPVEQGTWGGIKASFR